MVANPILYFTEHPVYRHVPACIFPGRVPKRFSFYIDLYLIPIHKLLANRMTASDAKPYAIQEYKPHVLS